MQIHIMHRDFVFHSFPSNNRVKSKNNFILAFPALQA
jgi:hypothetical protein